MSKIEMKIPWPPSVNAIWRTSKAGRVHRAIKYKAWSQTAGWEVKRANGHGKLNGAFAISITLRPPDDRRFDIDNRVKAILDLLQDLGVIENDHYCRLLVVRKGTKIANGMALLRLRPL